MTRYDLQGWRDWLSRILSVLLWGCGLGTLAGQAAPWHWVFELCCHFTAQLAAMLAALMAVNLLLRRWRASGVAAAMLVLLACRVLPLKPDVGDSGLDPLTLKVRLLLANVLSNADGCQPLLDFVAQAQPDILVVVELSPLAFRQLQPALEAYPHTQIQIQNDSFGVGVFSRFTLVRHEVEQFDEVSPTLIGEIQVDQERSFELIATHPVPPVCASSARRRNLQLRRLAEHSAASTLPVVLAGDLNCTPWSPYFSSLLCGGKLRDTCHGFGIQPSWPAGASGMLRIPIDHVLVPPSIVVAHRELGPAYASDHLPVLVGLQFP